MKVFFKTVKVIILFANLRNILYCKKLKKNATTQVKKVVGLSQGSQEHLWISKASRSLPIYSPWPLGSQPGELYLYMFYFRNLAQFLIHFVTKCRIFELWPFFLKKEFTLALLKRQYILRDDLLKMQKIGYPENRGKSQLKWRKNHSCEELESLLYSLAFKLCI